MEASFFFSPFLFLLYIYITKNVFFFFFVKKFNLCLSTPSNSLWEAIEMKALSPDKFMDVTSDVKMPEENDFLSRSMMNQSEEHHHEGANLDQSCRSTKIICYLKEDQSEFLEDRRQKDLVNEFVALTISEFPVQWVYPNNVRNGLKHVETHEHAGMSPVDAVD